ncbi:unnamed protein product [Candida verbasci]|uniref:Uncharacterized protein n=1 Tax=Candida verbasci TaxID=1227364 RepID=A0A9W4X9H6_9ASCO|nr:unnamed protein product [Candida verbasci]
MSILNEYSSSEEEQDIINNEQPPVKKQKLFDSIDIELQKEIETKRLAKELKKKRKGKNDAWATYSSDEEEQQQQQQQYEERKSEALIKSENTDSESNEFSTQFMGKEEFDYQGRSYLHCPFKSIEPGSKECYQPKKIINTIKLAHKKGVNKIVPFPNTGHLILSCGNDNIIKLWSNKFELLRIFKGHYQSAVKDVVFNSKGDKFLSCGFDKVVNLWDTQSGKVLKTMSVEAVPNVVRFGENDNEVLIGLANSKILHYDLINLQSIQIYDHHTGSINDLLIHDIGFISTSDDKSIRVWKWQINIPLKVISDPSLFSMPSIKKHPNANYIAIQSTDNKIKVIHSHGKYRWYKKKKFLGHQNAGYGIELNFSPDGKILMSGDAKGYVYFWDWQTCNQINRIQLGSRLIKTIVMNPQESSTIYAGCSSGNIYCLA